MRRLVLVLGLSLAGLAFPAVPSDSSLLDSTQVASSAAASAAEPRQIVEVWPKRISPKGGTVLVFLDPLGVVQSSKFFVERRRAGQDWEMLVQLAYSPNGVFRVTKAPGPYKMDAPKTNVSVIVEVKLPAEALGTEFRHSRLGLGEEAVVRVDGSAKPFRFVRPQRIGRSCSEIPTAVRNGRVLRFEEPKWVAIPNGERTCEALEPGLYRSLNSAGKTFQYFAVASR
jgi:hypothetical protein